MSRRVLLAIAALVLLLAAVGVWLANDPATLLKIAVRQERGAGDLTEHRLSLSTPDSQHEVVYLDGGDRSGPTVMLVHGFAADKDNWTRFAAPLKEAGFRVVALDLPGHGESTRDPAFSYDIANQVNYIEMLRAALQIDAMHIAGNSMGGHIAGAYASTHPDRVLSLGLFNAAGVTSPTPSERGVIEAETGTNPLLVQSVEDFDRLLAFVFVVPPTMPRVVKQYFADRATANRAFNDKIYADLGRRPMPLEPLLPAMQMPVLILWGDTDRVLHPSGAEVFAAGLRDSETVIMKDMGHSPMLERPVETAGIYIDFLDRSIEDGPASRR